MIVVDTNVVAALYLPGDHTERAERLLQLDPEWSAPLLWRSEFRNVLTSYMRSRALSPEQARALQSEAEDLLAGAEHHVDSGEVLGLAHASGCSAYDCEFVALAMRLRTRLATMDAAILRAFPEHALPLASI